jgi:hypothetical protein
MDKGKETIERGRKVEGGTGVRMSPRRVSPLGRKKHYNIEIDAVFGLN